MHKCAVKRRANRIPKEKSGLNNKKEKEKHKKEGKNRTATAPHIASSARLATEHGERQPCCLSHFPSALRRGRQGKQEKPRRRVQRKSNTEQGKHTGRLLRTEEKRNRAIRKRKGAHRRVRAETWSVQWPPPEENGRRVEREEREGGRDGRRNRQRQQRRRRW